MGTFESWYRGAASAYRPSCRTLAQNPARWEREPHRGALLQQFHDQSVVESGRVLRQNVDIHLTHLYFAQAKKYQRTARNDCRERHTYRHTHQH